MENKHIKVVVEIDVKNIEEYLEKANKYVELLKEANTLAQELASTKFGVEINQYQE